MDAKRIIPCIVIADGQLVPRFGAEDRPLDRDPLDQVARYQHAGADELMLFDASLADEGLVQRKALVKAIAATIDIPFIVGGGLTSLDEVAEILALGADKVAVNSAAIAQPSLINEAATRFGSERIIVSVSARRYDDQRGWQPFVAHRQKPTGLEAATWAREAESRGAGELLITSLEGRGTQQGYDIGLTRAVADAVSVPVIAAGGAGNVHDFADVFTFGGADAALAISLFNDNPDFIGEIKRHLREAAICGW
ncbi:MAG: imidazole glycerol phosphate synthase subunit HisF [Anaerolineales bacterium]|nr:imidazole glycerol phosphate synthase subunit HisF [Anaerolineales bacterium]MCB9129141.1 imidazole glycerol phosphate synthase subunit HisF [Ardenticatenales bacterium]